MTDAPERNTTAIPDETPHGPLGSKLAGRVALVTGGTRGIGAAITRSLASQGAAVAARLHREIQRLTPSHLMNALPGRAFWQGAG